MCMWDAVDDVREWKRDQKWENSVWITFFFLTTASEHRSMLIVELHWLLFVDWWKGGSLFFFLDFCNGKFIKIVHKSANAWRYICRRMVTLKISWGVSTNIVEVKKKKPSSFAEETSLTFQVLFMPRLFTDEYFWIIQIIRHFILVYSARVRLKEKKKYSFENNKVHEKKKNIFILPFKEAQQYHTVASKYKRSHIKSRKTSIVTFILISVVVRHLDSIYIRELCVCCTVLSAKSYIYTVCSVAPRPNAPDLDNSRPLRQTADCPPSLSTPLPLFTYVYTNAVNSCVYLQAISLKLRAGTIVDLYYLLAFARVLFFSFRRF